MNHSGSPYGVTWITALAIAFSSPILHAQPAPPVSPAPVLNHEYDAQGNPTRNTWAPGVAGFGFTASSTYDQMGRRSTATDARLKTTRFGYNGQQDLTQVTDPRNLVTQYHRNGFGDSTTLISPDTGAASLTYDAAGNLKTRTDSRGVLASHSYDALNRLTRVEYSSSQSGAVIAHVYNYDETGAGFAHGVGRLTSTLHPQGSTQYTYDAQGRLLTDIQTTYAATLINGIPVVSPVVATVTYGYDAAGNVTGIVYPSGQKVDISYVGGLPAAVSLANAGALGSSPLISQIQWEPFGAVKSWVWQLAASTSHHERLHDLSGRAVRYRLGDLLRDLSYDAAGRIISYIHYNAATGGVATAHDQHFGYDEVGRLTSVAAHGSNWGINYDANGNRERVTLNGVPRHYVTSATSNRLTTVFNPQRDFTYDAAGNTMGTLAYEASYDLTGRMSSVVNGGVATAYGIDAFGRRISKRGGKPNGFDFIFFVYGLRGELLGEYTSSGAAIREYIWLGSTPIATLTFGPTPANAASPVIHYIHTDHLDTPRAITDTAGRARWTWLSEPFGTTLPNNNPLGLGVFTFNLRMPGQYYDAETGLHYNRYRDYAPSIGRYVQADPIGLAGGINTYAYAESQSTSLTDPLGLATYMCRAPLHALTGALGEGRATWAMSNVPMAHHRYLCVPGQCGGQDQRGEKWSDPLWGPGKNSKDEFNAEHCEQKEPDNTCIENCVRRRLDGPRPTYGIPLATDCQEWAEEVLNSCRYECSSSTPTDRPYIGYPSSGRRSKR